MAAQIFYAEDGEIYICPAGSDLDEAGTPTEGKGKSRRARYKYSDYVTEISVSGGGRDIEQIQLFGKSGSPAQQNSIDRELPQEIFETSITAVVRDHTFNAMVNSDPFDSTLTSSGVTTIDGASTRAQVDIHYRFYDGTSQFGIKFANAYGISTEMSADSEGYLEETTGFKCLAKDFQKKYAADVTAGSAWPYSGEWEGL